jgi:hypothetical protein
MRVTKDGHLSLSTGIIKPASDSTTAVQVMKADGTTPVITVDTSNGNAFLYSTNTGGLYLYSTTANVALINTANGASSSTSGGGASFRHDSGSALGSGHRFGYLAFGGTYDTSHTNTNAIVFNALTTEAWDSTHKGAKLLIRGIPTGTATIGDWITIQDGKATFFTPTTSIASINLPHGTAPSSPTNGDCWTTTAGLYCRINGTTVGPYATSSSGVTTQTDQTSSRALTTVYQNTGTNPMHVNVVGYCSSSSDTIAAYTDSSSTPTLLVAKEESFTSDYGRNNYVTLSFIVLPNNYYKVIRTGSNMTINKWIEWN